MGKQAVPCQGCPNYPVHCARCREIVKAEMAAYLREEVPIYLSERNRGNKEKKLYDWQIRAVEGMSCRQAAKYWGVSAQTISRYRREYKNRGQ